MRLVFSVIKGGQSGQGSGSGIGLSLYSFIFLLTIIDVSDSSLSWSVKTSKSLIFLSYPLNFS